MKIMKNMKKKLGYLLTICMLGLMLTACGQNETSTQTEGEKNTTNEVTEKTDAGVKWPEGNVTFSIPGKAGGGSDLTSRYLASGWSDVKLSLMNFNSTVAAFQNIVGKQPDGKNIGLAHSAIMTQYVTGSEINPIEDLTLLAAVGNNGLNAVAVPKDAPYDTIEEFVEYAKQNPGKIKAGTSPNGTSKFTMGKIEDALGIKLNYVEASQQADRLTSLSGGFIDIGTISLKNGLEYEKAGKLKVIATIGANGQKVENFIADAPENFRTFQQQGYEDVYFVTSYYVIGPKGMDEALVKTINASLKEIIADGSGFVKGMTDMGQVPEWHDLEESMELYKGDLESMKKVAENLGMLDIKE